MSKFEYFKKIFIIFLHFFYLFEKFNIFINKTNIVEGAQGIIIFL
jgi:hypothetical protein